MAIRKQRPPSRWSHKGLERRGYKKCPYCWRHLVKIEEHMAAHEAGLIGPDGRRTDRTAEEQRRWAERFNGRPITARYGATRSFVGRARLEEILGLPPVDVSLMRRQMDKVVDQDA